jgi:hypothetical protein
MIPERGRTVLSKPGATKPQVPNPSIGWFLGTPCQPMERATLEASNMTLTRWLPSALPITGRLRF